MPLITVTSRDDWNSALAQLPLAHILQTWEWGQFKARHGWTPRYLQWNGEAGRPRAMALVLRRGLGRLPWCILYAPKGPVLDYADAALVCQVLADLKQFARQAHAIQLKIDPDLEPAHKIVNFREGWRESTEQIQFRNTMELDLRQSEEELLAAMHQKTRYNIRLAQRRGVAVRPGGLADLELLYAMYDETARRDRFIIRPLDYYRDAWGSFIEAGLAQPLIAEFEGAPIAAVMLFAFAGRAYYLYGMSRDAHRNVMAPHLLQWEALRWARARGCTVYDLWGAPDTLDESDPLWGVYRFKQGLGGQFVQRMGAWDYAPSRPLYWLYTAAMPRVLDLMRRRHWEARSQRPETNST